MFGVAISILLLVGGLVRIAQKAAGAQTVQDAAAAAVRMFDALTGLLLAAAPGALHTAHGLAGLAS